MKAVLQLHVTVAAGREVECAKHLASEVRGPHWAVLVALAAEIVQEHESRTAATVVVVVDPSQAAAVLHDIARAAR